MENNNPIKASDLYKDDGAIALAIKQLTELDKIHTSMYSEITGQVRNHQKAVKDANSSQDAGKEIIKQAAIDADKLAKAEKQLAAARGDVAEKLALLKRQQKEANDITKLTVQVNNSAAGSYDNVSAQYGLLKIKLNGMSEEARKFTAEGKKLEKESFAIYQEMKRLQEATGKNVLSVGDYAIAGQKAEQSFAELRKELKELRSTSFAGKSKEEIQALNQKIGDTVDKLGDLRAMQKAMGTELGSQIAGSLRMIAAGVEGVAGSLALFGVGEENIAKVQKNLVALIAVTQALGEIEDGLQKRTLQNTAMRIKSSIATGYDTVVKWANTTATTAQATATEAQAVITGKASIGTKAAAVAQWIWNAAVLAFPGTWLVLGIAALVAGIAALVIWQRNSAAESKIETERLKIVNIERGKSTKLLKDSLIAANEAYIPQKVLIDNLVKTIKNENNSLAERQKALKELIALDPKYLSGLNMQNIYHADGIAKIDKYKDALQGKARAMAYENELIKLYSLQYQNTLKQEALQLGLNTTQIQKKMAYEAGETSKLEALWDVQIKGQAELNKAQAEGKGIASNIDKLSGKISAIPETSVEFNSGASNSASKEKQDKALDILSDGYKKFLEGEQADYEAYRADMDKAQDQHIKDMDKSWAKIAEEEKAFSEASLNEKISYAKRKADEELNILSQKYAKGAISEKEYNDALYQMSLDQAQGVIDSLQTQLDQFEGTASAKLAIQTKLDEAIQAKRKAETDAVIKSEQQKREYVTQTFEALGNVGNMLFDNQAKNTTRELDESKKKYDTLLSNDKLSVAQKAAIQKKADREQATIKHKQDVAERRAALFNIAINTAVAVAKVWGQTGIWGIAAQIPVLIMGALQAALVMSQPLPKYFKGRKGGKSEFAITGERGAERIDLPGGKSYMTPGKPTLTYLPQGASVIPHEQSMNDFAFVTVPNYPTVEKMNINELRKEVSGLHRGFKMLADVISGKTETTFNLTERGFEKIVKNGTSTQRFLDQNVRF
ncbi:MAG: hypothetical protein ACOYMF_06020 [Bacteroidales bacterium]